MYKNGLFYGGITMLSLLTHISLLAIVFVKGEYDNIFDPVLLSVAVLGLDIVYFCILKFLKQNTYTFDILFITLLNMSVIFQSCFGKVGFAVKHYIFAVAALICCQIGYRLVQDYKFIEKHKYIFYGIIGVLIISIILFTGSRGMWINLGFITIQPSEFIKPFFVLVFATSLAAQQNKKKLIGNIKIVCDNWILLGITGLIVLLQWWCRDLGSLPTFAAVAACGFIMRICYPKAKLSKKMLIGIGIAGLAVIIVALKFAPGYVQDRLHVDIWSDQTGNGWQQCQALIAIAEGGWFGKGPGHGRLYKVPAADTDIVFSSISEEWGLLTALLAVFMIMLIIVTSLINRPRSYFHTTLTVGVSAVFVAQMALNIFGSCNMIPFTGVTIPFISQGGSSMLSCGLMAGFLKAGQAMVYPVPEKRPVPNQNRRTV
ncbi:FtsW/RodA/SpoVE family cell cycle protein [Porcipelethomonas sp.]|uniref:FtsW/RodA/SpoVE family cell cycle protein n=1 Tax=Porcipelethomonas sp. TaxID=2981675 RepID=UPI003EF98CA4